MANKVYPKWKEQSAQGTANASLAGALKAMLVDLADYTYSDAHEFLSDVPVAARVAISAALAGKTYTDGIIDANDTVFSAVTGDPSEALILFLDSGVAGTSRLFLFLDTGVTGLPVTPNGGDINTQWDNGANKIVKL
jgi:cobalamin synthase